MPSTRRSSRNVRYDVYDDSSDEESDVVEEDEEEEYEDDEVGIYEEDDDDEEGRTSAEEEEEEEGDDDDEEEDGDELVSDRNDEDDDEIDEVEIFDEKGDSEVESEVDLEDDELDIEDEDEVEDEEDEDEDEEDEDEDEEDEDEDEDEEDEDEEDEDEEESEYQDEEVEEEEEDEEDEARSLEEEDEDDVDESDEDFEDTGSASWQNMRRGQRLTARQRSMRTGSGPLLSLPLGPLKRKGDELSKAEVVEKRRQQNLKRIAKEKDEVLHRLLHQGTKKRKAAQVPQEATPKERASGRPGILFVSNKDGSFLSFPTDTPLPSHICQKQVPPPVLRKCAVQDCNHARKYDCAKSLLPACSLKCYKILEKA